MPRPGTDYFQSGDGSGARVYRAVGEASVLMPVGARERVLSLAAEGVVDAALPSYDDCSAPCGCGLSLAVAT